jgi:uncharacterized Fe-S cluster-containing protein
MVLYDHLCSVFPRGARKNRTPTEIRRRSAEGKNIVIALNGMEMLHFVQHDSAHSPQCRDALFMLTESAVLRYGVVVPHRDHCGSSNRAAICDDRNIGIVAGGSARKSYHSIRMITCCCTC